MNDNQPPGIPGNDNDDREQIILKLVTALAAADRWAAEFLQYPEHVDSARGIIQIIREALDEVK